MNYSLKKSLLEHTVFGRNFEPAHASHEVCETVSEPTRIRIFDTVIDSTDAGFEQAVLNHHASGQSEIHRTCRSRARFTIHS